MSASQGPSPSNTAAPSGWTAQEVLEMFAALGLPVCDDGNAIQQKVASQQNRYLSDKKNPDPSMRARADRWFKNVDAMQNRRPELLQVVYEHFAGLGRTALAGALASGVRTLTPVLLRELRGIAVTACRVDDPLASRFLDDFMKAEDLQPGEDIVRPSLVENFTAASGQGEISLSWSMPPAKCDEVEIVREAEATTQGLNRIAEVETVFPRGKGAFFRDTGLSAGVWYTYRVHSFYQDVKSAAARVVRAVCVGEVRAASAVWKDGKVCVRWELPGAGVAAIIFRRRDRPPLVRPSPGGTEAADAHTTQVYRGSETSWFDPDVIEGATYHYRIVADFGSGLFGKGVDVQATVPKAPPAVPAVTASHKRTADGDVVLVEWQVVPGGLPVDYLVVRRDGSAPPGRVEEGVLVQTTTQNRCLDQGVVAGCRYTYTVFTRAGEMLSRTGTAAPPVDILAEVTGLVAKTASGTVELSWDTPANVSAVIVRRSLNPPRDHADGTLVRQSGAGHAKDEGLRNGQRNHYLVSCGYRPEGAAEVFSPGVRIAAVPEELPDPVKEFKVQAQGSDVVCTWTPPQHGQVVVLRSAKPHGKPFGDRLHSDEVNALGERVVTAEGGRAVDSRPDIQKPYYSVFTIAGSHAVAGGAGACVVSPDVSDLKLSAVKEGVILRWVWPPGCTNVRVARRADAWPEGPEDPRASVFPCSRTEYMSAGDKLVDSIESGRARFHYIVYAQPAGVADLFFSPGTASGCREVIQWEPWMTVRYRLSSPDKGPHKGREILMTWIVEKPFPNFSGLVLVASQTGVPLAPDDGEVIFRWEPGPGTAAGDHEAWISLEPIRRRRWARFFCKAMVVDPAQRHTTLLIHPNTAVPISETGEIQTLRSEGPRVFRAGVPKTVICPLCFEEFHVGRMLFTSFGGDESMPARHTWVDRLRGLPPQPPTNKQGQRLTRKLCPNRDPLPFTAGAQGSLVIGLIGAKFSGKSHYIASLVKRLEGQVGGDLQAALIPVSDETQERYRREFYDPLFKNGLELPLTVGTPAPLIYDLTLDGRLWGEERNRAVTLALYDTAGENLDSQDTVEQMLKYLRVASGIVFLVDPLQVAAVCDALPASVRLPDADRMVDPNVILSRVLQVLEDGRVVTQSGPLSTPVAVVLTKCDVLRDAGLIEANRLWNTDARHVGYFDAEAHSDMTGMMAEYVQRWSPAAYHTVRQRFSRHAFFGASATGCASDTTTRRYKYISPWRVEDPLLWLLAELGVIPSRGGEEKRETIR